MSKSYYSLGLMSGTSMDGVDASIIQSDGETKHKVIIDKYFRYSQVIYKNLIKLRDKIISSKDLKRFSKEVNNVEKEITLFHAKAVNQILKKAKVKVDFIGFHGQTIYHNAKEKISKQLGHGKLLSKLTKKKVVYNFRQNDLKNGGMGAPLTPIFHKKLLYNLVANNEKPRIRGSKLPLFIINIGGITNITSTDGSTNSSYMYAQDIGPGNYLVDKWMRLKSKKKYDKDGKIASLGKINKIMLKKFVNVADDSSRPKSFDVSEFKLPSGFQSLSLKDGAATLTELTAEIIFYYIELSMDSPDQYYIVISGGGRKNKFLMKRIEQKMNFSFRKLKQFVWKLKTIDNYGIDGDFVESQAFAYLAIRSYLKLPISFPETTGCSKPCTGGVIVKNF